MRSYLLSMKFTYVWKEMSLERGSTQEWLNEETLFIYDLFFRLAMFASRAGNNKPVTYVVGYKSLAIFGDG